MNHGGGSYMVEFHQVDTSYLEQYNTIPMQVYVSKILQPIWIENGLGGFRLEEKKVEPYLKDLASYADTAQWQAEFDLSHWAFFMAFDDGNPVGGSAVLGKTPNLRMLGGRDDLALLWDIRVDNEHKRNGIGSRLFDMAVNWAREQGYAQLHIESQNNNLPACHFYVHKGARLGAVDQYAYYLDKGSPKHEMQLIWYLDL